MFVTGFVIGALARWLYGFGPTVQGSGALVEIAASGMFAGLLAAVIL